MTGSMALNVGNGFNYHSLYEVAKSEDIDFPLVKQVVELLSKKDTINFETAINLLLGAILDDEVIEGG